MNTPWLAIAVKLCFVWMCASGPPAQQPTEPPAGRAQGAAAEALAPRLVVEPRHVDLGTVRQGGVYEFSYMVKNEGQTELLIHRIQSTCGCTVTEPKDPQRLLPGEWITLNASFDSQGRIGRQIKDIAVYSDDPAAPLTQLSFEAEVEAVYQVRPHRNSVRFLNRRPGEPLDQALTLLAGRRGAELEIVDVRFDRGGLSARHEPTAEDGYKGYRLHFSLSQDVPIGWYHNTVRLRVRSGGEVEVVDIPVRGQVVSQIAYLPGSLLSVAPVLPGSPLSNGRLTLRAIDRSRPFRIRRIDGGRQLSWTIEESEPGLEYVVHFSVAGNARKGPVGRDVYVFTDSHDQPVITIPAYVYVDSPVDAQPEVVYLRRPSGENARASQIITIRSTSGQDLEIEGVSTDNANIVVTEQRRAGERGTHALSVALAPSAPKGQHQAQITLHTNVAGAKEVIVRVYAEVAD